MDNDHATSCERTGERELNKNKVVNPRDSPERGREKNQGESTLSLRIFGSEWEEREEEEEEED